MFDNSVLFCKVYILVVLIFILFVVANSTNILISINCNAIVRVIGCYHAVSAVLKDSSRNSEKEIFDGKRRFRSWYCQGLKVEDKKFALVVTADGLHFLSQSVFLTLWRLAFSFAAEKIAIFLWLLLDAFKKLRKEVNCKWFLPVVRYSSIYSLIHCPIQWWTRRQEPVANSLQGPFRMDSSEVSFLYAYRFYGRNYFLRRRS